MFVGLGFGLGRRGYVGIEVEMGWVGVVGLRGRHVVDLVLVVEELQVPEVDAEALLLVLRV
jgi:hypothetical protein